MNKLLIFGTTKSDKYVIFIVYSLILVSVFLPFQEVISSGTINKTSQLVPETGLYASVLRGYESVVFLFNLMLVVIFHLRTFSFFSSSLPSKIMILLIWTLVYAGFLFSEFILGSAFSGNPVGDTNLSGIYISAGATILLILYSYYALLRPGNVVEEDDF